MFFCFENNFHRKRHRDQHTTRNRGYMKKLDNPHEPLNDPKHLTTASPVVLPSAPPSNDIRPHSASSTTSSMIIHQNQDVNSDRESLIHSKPTALAHHPSSGLTAIDNFYEEIKEQQQQTALALSRHGNVNEPFNPYLEARYFPDEQGKKIGYGNSQPIRDHHEVFYYECAPTP